MASDDKDRLGDRLRDVDAAREDQWARQRDAELVENMRKRLNQTACPRCKQFLVPKTEDGMTINVCPGGCGAWVDAHHLKSALKPPK